MVNRFAISALFYFLSFSVHAEILQITLSGTVSEVDPELSSEFVVEDSFEYGITIDTSTAFDIWGANTSMDGTRIHSPISDRSNYFKIGSRYQGTLQGSVQPIFVDKWVSIGPSQQGFLGGMNNFEAPDIVDLSLGEVYFKFGFSDVVFTGVDDSEDVIDVNQLMQLDGIGINNIESLVSFLDSTGEYHYVRINLDDFSVVDITPIEAKNRYIGQVGLADTDGNGVPEVATLYVDANSNRTFVVIRDALTDKAVRRIGYYRETFIPISISVIPDVNGNGIEEIAVLGHYLDDTRSRTLIRDAQTREILNAIYQKF